MTDPALRRFLRLLGGHLMCTALACCTLTAAASEASGAAANHSVPEYVRLAYRPEQPIPLLALPGTYWTVQVLALSSKEALESYARKHGLQDMSAARIAHNGQLYYALLLGVYQTRENAEQATRDLPLPFAPLDVWVRPMSSLQAAMLQANRLAGNESF